MKKNNFVMLIVFTVAGLLFALGMCMCLVPEWDLFKPGVVVTGLGLLMLLAAGLSAWIRAGKPVAKIDWAKAGKIAYTVVSLLVLGAGMSMIMVFDGLMIPGMIVGVAGIIMLLCLIPLYKGLKD